MSKTIKTHRTAIYSLVALLAAIITLGSLTIVAEARERSIELREDRWSRIIEIRDEQVERLKDTFGMTDEHDEPGHDSDSNHGGNDGHSDNNDDGGHMGHGVYEYVGDNPPTIDIILHEDAKKGYNLEIVTENYDFAPEAVNTEPVAGEGHAHLYINGEKITRLYAPWFYIGSLEPGEHLIRVELSANNHSPYAVAGELIDAVAQVTIE